MLFNSYAFVILLALTFTLYYLPVFRKVQLWILIGASSVFYAYHNIILLLLLYTSILINALTGYAVMYGNPGLKKAYATLGVTINLSLLFFFKYSPLFASTFLSRDAPLTELLVTIPLPIGISFYTFQGISILVDAYRDRLRGHTELVPVSFGQHLRNTVFYISFFPHLVAGPIVKAHDFLPQIRVHYFSDIDWEFCFRKLVIGYFLKLVVADNLKEFTFWIEYPYFLSYKPVDLFALLVGYSCQIFADFAGYSTIAIGLAMLFGYRLGINFNFPYIAGSFKDFWKRWHISLSSFLMEYLYFPLGGSKKGKLRTYFNLFMVMTLGGLWHGAAWSYLVWGFAHGLFLSIERLVFETLKVDIDKFSNALYSLFVFIAVTFAWLLFRLEFTYVVLYLKTMFSGFSLSFDTHLMVHLMVYSLPVVLYHVYALAKERNNRFRWYRYEYAAFAVLLFLIVFNNGISGTFIYFQF